MRVPNKLLSSRTARRQTQQIVHRRLTLEQLAKKREEKQSKDEIKQALQVKNLIEKVEFEQGKTA
jgi:hypothetical protein